MSPKGDLTVGLGIPNEGAVEVAAPGPMEDLAAGTDAVERSPTRVQAALWVAILAIAVVISLLDYDSFQLGTYSDDVTYAVLARSIVEGDEYRLISVPEGVDDTATFPFGYPLLLAPVVLLYPDTPDAMRALSLIATGLNAAMLFWGWHWFSRRSHWWALAVAGLCLLSPIVISTSRMVMSEPVYTTLGLAAILLVERIARGERTWWHVAALGMVAAMAFFVRTVGIVVFPSAALYMLWRLRARARGMIGMVMLAMAGTFVIIVVVTPVAFDDVVPLRYLRGGDAALLHFVAGVLLGDGQELEVPAQVDAETALDEGGINLRTFFEYTIYRGLTEHIAHRARWMIVPIGGRTSEAAVGQRLGMPYVSQLLGAVFTLVLMAGIVRWILTESRKAALLFAAVYFGSILLWAWNDPRFLYPIQAQLVFGFLLGAEWIIVAGSRVIREPSRLLWQRALTGSVVVILAGLGVRASVQIEPSRLHVGDLAMRTAWIRENAAPDAIVMSEQSVLDYFYGERHTIQQPVDVTSAGELLHYLREHSADYVLLAPYLRWQPVYDPQYSDPATRLRALLMEVVEDGYLEQVYKAEADAIEVFKVRLDGAR